MDDLFPLISKLDIDVKNIKSILYLIQTEKFQQIFKLSDRKEVAVEAIKNADKDKLKLWYDFEKQHNLYFSSVEQLRHLCSCYQIPKYQYLQREEMIELINGHRENQARKGSSCEVVTSGIE